MSIEQTLGEHRAKLEALGNDVTEIKSDLKQLLADKSERKGAGRLVTAMATVAGAFGGVLSEVAITKWGK
jgi:hypothetical protein